MRFYIGQDTTLHLQTLQRCVYCLDGRRLDNLGGDERCLAGDQEEYREYPWCAPGPAQCCLAGTVGLADLGFIL